MEIIIYILKYVSSNRTDMLLGSFPFLSLFPLKGSDSFPSTTSSEPTQPLLLVPYWDVTGFPTFQWNPSPKRLLDRQTFLFLVLTTSHSITWICNQIKSFLPIRGKDDEEKKEQEPPAPPHSVSPPPSRWERPCWARAEAWLIPLSSLPTSSGNLCL